MFNSITWRLRQADLYEFEAILVYIVNSQPSRATQRYPVSKKKEGRKEGKKEGRKKERKKERERKREKDRERKNL